MYQLSYHFFEIRLRIVYILFSVILTLLASYYYQIEILYIIGRPFLDLDHKFILIDLTEAFYTIIKICGILTFLIIFPFFVYHFWSFYIPSRYQFERKLINKFTFFFFFMVSLELCILYFFIFPKICEFLLSFQILSSENGLALNKIDHSITNEKWDPVSVNTEKPVFTNTLESTYLNGVELKKDTSMYIIQNQDGIPFINQGVDTLLNRGIELQQTTSNTMKTPAFLELTARLQSYVKLSTRFYFIMCTLFQIPFVVYLLYYYNIIDCYILCKSRKFFLFSSLLISALISPPDIVSQCIVAILMFFFYELLIVLGIFLEYKK